MCLAGYGLLISVFDPFLSKKLLLDFLYFFYMVWVEMRLGIKVGRGRKVKEAGEE